MKPLHLKHDWRLSALLCATAVLSACDRLPSASNTPAVIAPEAAFAKMIQKTHALREADAKA